ncbi:hypothetical protein F2Q68_00020606 [Brassica cretica]|uniref:Uncharacterized protein n=1 Tax=Brassica cretica TaxID=69181 RepID=A0A8S9FUF5_BRACR|nr:hypothetical protein F2Q68_00020606 [Brassica cretica]
MKALPDLSAIIENEVDPPRNNLMMMLDGMGLDGTSGVNPHTESPLNFAPEENIYPSLETTMPLPRKANKKRSRDDVFVTTVSGDAPEVVDRTQTGECPKKKKKKKPAAEFSEPCEGNETREVDHRKKKKKYADGETLTPSGPSDRSAASGGVDRELDLPPAASGSLIPRRSRVEFPDHVEFSYSGDTPLIYDPPKCAELSDGSMNFVIEKYDSTLKQTFVQLGRSERQVETRNTSIARAKEDLNGAIEARDRAVIQKKVRERVGGYITTDQATRSVAT